MKENSNNNVWMLEALKQAEKAKEIGEVPVGAVIVYKNKIIATGFNRIINKKDVTAHAEIIALRKASNYLNNYRLNHCIIYVTLEPCMMCLGAIIHARLKKIYFSAKAPKFGVVHSNLELHKAKFLNHKIEVQGGIMEKKSSDLLKQFFFEKRKKSIDKLK